MQRKVCIGEGDSKTQEGGKGVVHSSNIQGQFRHTNSQNTFQEVVNKAMTVCEYGLQLGVYYVLCFGEPLAHSTLLGPCVTFSCHGYQQKTVLYTVLT